MRGTLLATPKINQSTRLAVVIYRINCLTAFTDARQVPQEIVKGAQVPGVPKILVGYKQEDIGDNQQVRREEGKTMVCEYVCAFLKFF